MITILLDHITVGTGRKYRQIAEGIRKAIGTGALRAGDRLPPQRELADALGVTLGTVTRAYEEIDALGLIKGEIGRGTFVTRREEEEFTLHALHNRTDLERSGRIRFDLNFPVAEPGPDLGRLLVELADQPAIGSLLRYQPTAGLENHRRTACRWLDRLRLPVGPERVAITTGAQHGLLVALGSQLEPGDALAVDPYTYPGIINLASFLHLRLIPVDSDPEGMRPEGLARAASRQRLKGVYLIPTLHNPTTLTMGQDRRRELAELVRRLDLVLLEDDVYGGLAERNDEPIAALLPERSFFVTSMSKVLAPGLRLGFLVMPEGRLRAVERVMAASIWMNPPLCAELGCRWIADGTVDRVLSRKRASATERMAVIREKLGGWDLHCRTDGLHAWLRLPPPWTGETFARRAAESGVQVIPSVNFSTGGAEPVEAVRLCVGPPRDTAETAHGAEILAAILAGPPMRGEPIM